MTMHEPAMRHVVEWATWVKRLAPLAPLIAVAACGEPAPSPAIEHAEHATAESVSMTDSAPAADAASAADAVARQMVRLTAEQERALGVVYMEVSRRVLERTIRTVGRIEAAEQNVADVTPKIDGFVERLFVATTGETVRRGQPLLALYSPELVAAQEELLTARNLLANVDPTAVEATRSAQAMLDAARRRLAYWDITQQQIERLERTGEVTKDLTLVSPVDGVVLEKNVIEGQRVSAGALLYRLADLSEVWVEGDVFEQDIQFVRVGSLAHIEVAAYPGEHLMGEVSFVYPVVDVNSRTNRVRVTLANRDSRLKPGMFATIFFDAAVEGEVVAVPNDAVMVTGERNLVFVRDAEAMLRPREVVLGPQAEGYVQILAGLEPGETIVASANFLIDAESQLGTTGGDMPGMQHSGHGSVIEPDGRDGGQ
jgi:Cu(I)/Ag(I) efflux system membrane fusion protein